MVFSKRQIIIMTMLLISVMVIFILLINESVKSYKKANYLGFHLKSIDLCKDMSETIIKMTSNVNDYFNYHDIRYLDSFRRNSAVAVKYELELYNIMAPSKKQDIDELIELTQAYSSFVEKDVLPAIEKNQYNSNDIKYLQFRHKEFSIDLTGKINSLSEAGKGDTEAYFQQDLIGGSTRVTLLLVFLLLSLTILIVFLSASLKRTLTRYVYLEKLFGHIINPVIAVDRGGVIRYLNKPVQDLLDISHDGLKGKNIGRIAAFYPHLQSITQPLYDVMLQGKEIISHRVTYRSAERKIELVVDYIPVYIFNRPEGAMMIAALAGEKKDKHVLLDTLEAERKRISIEIHDWIGRHMSTMIHSLDYILRLTGGSVQREIREQLLALRSHCQNAAIEMRGIMNDIHPYLIDRVGLISALESYISTFEKLNKINVYVLYQDRSLRVKKKDEIIIYRIIQEALTNVAKHAMATEVDIEFTISHDTLKIEVADNGGSTGDFSSGKGLWGMKERANLIGGDIVFENSGPGFCVTITVPIIPGGRENEQNQGNAD